MGFIGQQLPFDRTSGFSGQWVLGDTRIDFVTGDITNASPHGLGLISGFSIVGSFAGDSGASGFTGISGFSGEGFSGPSGFSGASGFSGEGFSGPSGPSGPSGISGFSGTSGISGTSGFSSLSGVSGFTGRSGYSGQSGHSGASGFSGISGVTGFSGFSGFADPGEVASAFSSLALSVVGARLGFSSVSKVIVGSSGRRSSARDSNHQVEISWSGVLVGDLALNGVSGLDTGSEASDTWYAVYVITDDNSSLVNILFSTASSDPALPAGYTVYRRIGWVRNDSSSNILRFVQLWGGPNRKYWWDEANDHNVLAGGSATTFTLVDCSNSVPPTTRDITLRIEIDPKTAASTAGVRTPGFSATLGNLPMDIITGTARPAVTRVFLATDSDQMIEYVVSDPTDVLTIDVVGFSDELDEGLT